MRLPLKAARPFPHRDSLALIHACPGSDSPAPGDLSRFPRLSRCLVGSLVPRLGAVPLNILPVPGNPCRLPRENEINELHEISPSLAGEPHFHRPTDPPISRPLLRPGRLALEQHAQRLADAPARFVPLERVEDLVA